MISILFIKKCHGIHTPTVQLPMSVHPFIAFVAFLTVATPAAWWFTQQAGASHVFIAEASFANNDKQDWVAVYNPTLNSKSLKGYYLSDDLDDPLKWQVTSDWVVASHDAIVFYGKSAKQAPYGAPKLNFNLSNGETLVLTAPDGSSQLDRMTLVAPPNYDGAFTLGRSSTENPTVEVFYHANSSAGATTVAADGV